MKEEEDNIDEAAKILQELQVKKKKKNFQSKLTYLIMKKALRKLDSLF